MTHAEALRQAIEKLRAAGIDGAAGDARRLLAHAAGVGPDRVTLILPDAMTAEAGARFDALITRRAERHPVSHLVGERMFYGRKFTVTPDVLDPRPETEELIAAALERPFDSVLDLGTGSGAILLTLLAERKAARGMGTDISRAALAVARRNAEALGVVPDLRVADWWDGITGRFDLIVSNPPYIAASEMAGLAPELSREPRVALTDESDGLSAYRTITKGAVAHLNDGGWLMVEIGPKQGRAVSDMFAGEGFAGITTRQDMDGRDRVIMGQNTRN